MHADAVAAVVVVVVLAAIVGVLVAVELRRNRRRSAGQPAHTGARRGPRRGLLSRREVVNRGLLAVFGLGLAAMTAAVVRFLWPSFQGRSGTFVLGTEDDLRRRLAGSRSPYFDDNGRFFVVPYPAADLARASRVYDAPVLAGMRAGYVALSERCPHQGCAVPWCSSSQWFECPCHGSKFNRVGERKAGPASRGMDRYLLTVDAQDRIVVDTRRRFLGPPIGVDTTGQGPEGPHCV